MNDRIVILEDKQWTACWQSMCDELGYVPAWCDYSKYFGSVGCYSTKDEGLKIIFEDAVDAMAFKLEWS